MPEDHGSGDEQLARAASAGSRHAFCQLVERYQRPLFRFLRMRTGNDHDAEEILQDACLRAWSRMDLFDCERPFATWLYTIAARLAASHRRRRKTATASAIQLASLTEGEDPALAAATLEQERNLWDAAARHLSADGRSALWLFYGESRSAREVAMILGKTEGAVRVLLHRARETLSHHLLALR